MWHIVAFDIPADDRAQRKCYRTFRKNLLASGYNALQKSIYYRWFESSDKALAFQKSLLSPAPEYGDIFTVCITDASFLNSLHISNNNDIPLPKVPEQWHIY